MVCFGGLATSIITAVFTRLELPCNAHMNRTSFVYGLKILFSLNRRYIFSKKQVSKLKSCNFKQVINMWRD